MASLSGAWRMQAGRLIRCGLRGSTKWAGVIGSDVGLPGSGATPIYIVTARAGGKRAGCIVGFASQVSIHPLRFLACVSKKNATYTVARAATRLGVHAVPKTERELATLFGGETGDEIDKFARCDWFEASDGTPLLVACPSRFLGRTVEQIDLGDHLGIVIGVEQTWHGRPDFAHLTVGDLANLEPGHAP